MIDYLGNTYVVTTGLFHLLVLGNVAAVGLALALLIRVVPRG